MKIIAIIASHKRNAILRDCITCLKPQVDDIVLAGSSDWTKEADACNLAKRIAKENDLLYVDHSNKILGQKWQAGLNRARLEKPDAVLICGSDDLLSDNYVEEYKYVCLSTNVMSQLKHVCGVNAWRIYSPIHNNIAYCEYKYSFRRDPLGAGRCISSEALDRVDWQIFPTEGGVGCDLYSWEKLGNKIWHPLFGYVLSVKGSWDMMDSWDQVISSKSLRIDMEDSLNFILNCFPHVDFDKYRSK